MAAAEPVMSLSASAAGVRKLLRPRRRRALPGQATKTLTGCLWATGDPSTEQLARRGWFHPCDIVDRFAGKL